MDDAALLIIPLGGLGEIGLNMTVFRYGDDIIAVDAGLMFPEEEMLGVDVVIPDFSYLTENRENVRGIFITHGHEDHIGAIPYLLREMNIPVYGTPLTIGLISEKLKEHDLDEKSKLIPIRPGEVIDAGSFSVEGIRITHSIVDGVGFGITTPAGRIVHTGDFKFDQTPVDGQLLDVHRFADYGNMGTLVLLSDSTNSEREGYCLSEREVGVAFNEIFASARKRIIVATFASNIHRIQQVIDAAAKYDRRVILNGRSVINNTRIAEELGYLHYPPDVKASMDDLNELPDDKVVIVTTGSQGEPMSSLSRMAMDDHKHIKIKEGDMVLLSSRFIPGNERAIGRVINHLFRRGANVLYEQVSDIHVSGHACREEQKMMLNLVKPKYFIPVHGEYRHLVYHARLAEGLGIPRENILILEDGDVAHFSKDGASIAGKVESGRVFVDGKGIGEVGGIVLRDRKHLGMDGIIIVMTGIEKSSAKVITGPDIITRGFIHEGDYPEVIEELRQVVITLLGEMEQESKQEWIVVKDRVTAALKRYIKKKMERRPMIIPIIIEV
ncbi:MAG: ribonuclease J [Nitrospirae bacterium]|nr:ribonuclease J [Nitrospirota bacterium]